MAQSIERLYKDNSMHRRGGRVERTSRGDEVAATMGAVTPMLEGLKEFTVALEPCWS